MGLCLRLMCLTVLVLVFHVMISTAAVTVRSLRARDLAGDALGNKPDPYVMVSCNKVSGGRTVTKPSTAYPGWSEVFSFASCKSGQVLKMVVYDEDVKDDDVLGTCTKTLSKGTFTDIACAMTKKGTLIYNLSVS
ncbi:cytosolic phospholipase A2 delta-like [Brachyhypopomus gauderio]|uniref:cytosolic phospholipase A2 delta-like n=1 Tax=Brachyhypopomus gauderio TaxID=698409 RepID=UPI004041640A